MNVDIHTLFEICEPAARGIGYEVVDVEWQRASHGWVLRVFIDHLSERAHPEAAGIGLSDCERASRELSAVLDVADQIHVPYHLEVSSPGFDRPLRKERDFARFAGQRARIRLKEPISTSSGQRKNFSAVLLGAGDERFEIESDGVVFDIPLTLVSKAHLDSLSEDSAMAVGDRKPGSRRKKGPCGGQPNAFSKVI